MLNPKDPKDFKQFIAETGVDDIIVKIETNLRESNGGKRPFFSDLYSEEADANGNTRQYEYVNYVQEGGGVLGVALVGFTYVLERMGFRFLKLAGTSAGAINTMMLACIDKKNYTNREGFAGKNFNYQSEIILQEMLNYDLWKLVDGHWFAKWLISLFVTKSSSVSRLRRLILFSLIGALLYAVIIGMLKFYRVINVQSKTFEIIDIGLLALGGLSFVLLMGQWVAEIRKSKNKAKARKDLPTQKPLNERQDKPLAMQIIWVFVFVLAVLFLVHGIFFHVGINFLGGLLSSAFWEVAEISFDVVGAVSVLCFAFVIVAIIYFKGRFERAGFGINPGDNFYKWMGDILQRNGIETMAQLEAAMAERMNPSQLKLRPDPNRPNDESNTLVGGNCFSIMASDITLQTKVEFPQDCKHYFEFPEQADPAQFVRASMAIPVFFEPFRLNVPYAVQQRSSLQKMKATEADKNSSKDKLVRFVDGGILSNFPINVFHNPALKIARMATIGVKLEDEEHEPETVEGQGLQATTSVKKKKKPKDTLLSLLGNVFSTVRFYYDREFLKRNGVYQQCIAHVDVENINWLNFGMDYQTQKDLFIRGAKAAEIFFCGGEFFEDGKPRQFSPFNWEKFKKDRAAMVAEVQKATGVSS